MFCRLKRLFLLLILPLFSPYLAADESDASPKEGWVLFANEPYFPLLEVALASIHEFSTRPVVVVGMNADVPFSLEMYPRLIKKRIDVDFNLRKPYFYKPQAIIEADLDYGVYLDADAILNKGCDALFDMCRKVDEFPLCPTHEDDAWVLEDALTFFNVTKRSMHYVHSDVIVYSKKCQSFIEEWNRMCLDYPQLGVPVWDETLINVLFWMKGATVQLLRCDPYNAYFDDYLKMTTAEMAKPPYSYWFVFHGNKDVDRGWRMLFDLVAKHSP